MGSLNFAKALNRTLILPPWIEYRQGAAKSIQVPFDHIFQVKPIQKFHRAITMHNFMKTFAGYIWPEEKRRSFCYMERKSLTGSLRKDCHAKEGNPFGPFWDEFGIDFVGSEFFGPLHYDTWHGVDTVAKWHTTYPADKYPVLAFTGAPASFPVQADNVGLQRYLLWAEKLFDFTRVWMKATMPRGAYLGIHLRNGVDWGRACEHISDSPNLFSAAQCLGYRNERGVATKEMCQPSFETIVKDIKHHMLIYNAQNSKNQIKSIFVASDNDHMIYKLNAALRRQKVNALYLHDKPNPHMDLIILERANLFIGNCISSFSAFVIRSRNLRSFPSAFWGYDNATIGGAKPAQNHDDRDEL